MIMRGAQEVSGRPEEFLRLIHHLQHVYLCTPYVERNNRTLEWRIRMKVRGKTLYSKECEDGFDALQNMRVKLIAMYGPESEFKAEYAWKSWHIPNSAKIINDDVTS